MNIPEAYDYWSSTYDTVENLTRDLDRIITRDSLADFQCKTILEIGCGTGKNTALLAKVGEQVLALDISRRMIRKAVEKLGSESITFSIADINNQWPCADEYFDLVVCNLVLEHIEGLDYVFSQAFRSLVEGGHFFVCELHPFRQYQGTKARFESKQGTYEIQAFVHHLSDYLEAAKVSGLKLQECKEWWHEQDQGEPPRLVSFMFEK